MKRANIKILNDIEFEMMKDHIQDSSNKIFHKESQEYITDHYIIKVNKNSCKVFDINDKVEYFKDKSKKFKKEILNYIKETNLF